MKNIPIKRFIKYFKPVLGLFLLDCFFAVILAVVSVGTPFIAQYIIKASQVSNFTIIYIGIGLMASLLGVRLFANYIVTFWGHIMGVKMEVAMRNDAVAKLHKLKMTHFDRTSTGTYISRIVTDLKDIPEFAHHAPEDFIIAVLTAIGGLTYAFLQSWIIGLVLIIILFIGVFVVYFIRTKWRKIWTEIREHNSSMSAAIGQQVEGVVETKSFASEAYEVSRFKELHRKYLKTYQGFYRFEGFFTITNIIIMSATSLITLAIGAILVAKGSITLPQLVGLTMAATILNQPMQKFVNVYTMISRGSSAVNRFYEFMDNPEEDNEAKLDAPIFKGDIKFINVNFSYVDQDGKTVTILKDFNLHIKQGEKLALVGETGIGKSTILKLILRFYELNGGKILIDDENVTKYSLPSLRQRMGYIQQHATMFEDTIKNNILYGNPKATQGKLEDAAKNAYINDFIEKLSNGYETIAGPRGAKLSGGQKQRISLARTFLIASSIMLMDEATSALDNDTEDKIKKSIAKLTKNKTTIIVAHRLSTIKDVDRVIVIGKGGVILEQGTHSQLLKSNGHYFDLYNK